MIVCICSNLNENKLRNIIKCNKIKSVKEFHKLQLCCDCHKCNKEIKKIIKTTDE